MNHIYPFESAATRIAIEKPRCYCGANATGYVDLSTVSATIAPNPYAPRCDAHHPEAWPWVPYMNV